MSKAIYKMDVDFDRLGTLEGIFVADEKEMSDLISSGKEVYFGEVLGKHSEVFFPIEDSDVEKITDDQNFIELFEKFRMSTGYNPFDYLDQ